MRRPDRNIWPIWTLLFLTVMVLPLVAMIKLSETIDPLFLLIFLFPVWSITFFSYWLDKKKAKNQEWRIPESNLHLMAAIGGWGSAFWAQRYFRHKIRKVSFQCTFWFIAVIQQYLAYDFLKGWQYSERILNLVMSQIK